MTNSIAKSLITLAASAALAASHAFADELPSGPVPSTFGVQLKEDNLDADDLDRVQALGIKVVRRGFLWSNVEKEKGVYDFSRYEKLVTDCEARGIRVMACLALGNKLYPHVKDDEGRAAYVKYAVAAVEKFKGRNVLWELWNEPNVMTFWGKHGKVGNSEQYAEEYTNLVKAVVPAMKKADPDCIILGGSVSNLWTKSYEWQQYCFARGMLKTGIDVWSVHPYGLKAPEDAIPAYAKVRQLMKDAGGPVMTMLNSERGFTTIGKGEGEGDIVGIQSLRGEYQAWHVVRQFIVDQLEDMKLTIWYEWGGKDGFALLKPDGTESQAFKATKVLIDTLRGYTLDQRLPTDQPRDFVVRYKDDKGRAKLVVWTAPPDMQNPDKTVEHEIQIAVEGASGKLAVTDLYGAPSEVEAQNGKITIKLTGAPQYITLPTKQ